MNLHGIVSPIIAAVNPMIEATIKQSDGYTKTSDHKQVPLYNEFPNVKIQVQALSAKELAHIDSLGIQGVLRGIYLNGNWQGVLRKDAKGGDLIVFNDETWLVTTVLESWPDWTKVAVTLQID